MKTLPLILVGFASVASADCQDEVLFKDDFHGKLGSGWSWVREHSEAWRTSERGLEVRIEPGNMWGPQNDARNVLLRPAPDFSKSELEISLSIENNPTHQYEQVDLVCYYNDSNMVKLGQELVDGKLSIVMGREQADKTRTIAIVPLDSASVRVRLLIKAKQIRGQFLREKTNEWTDAGECDLPAVEGIEPKVSIQFYQGPADVEHWTRVNDFRISRVKQ